VPRLKTLAKALVSLALLGWVAARALEHDVAELFASANAPELLLAVVLHLLVFILQLVRWKVIISLFRELTMRYLARSYFIGIFSNNFLPSSVGGDFVRGMYLFNQGLPAKDIALASIIDRAVGLLVVVCVGAASLLATSGVAISGLAEYEKALPRLAMATGVAAFALFLAIRLAPRCAVLLGDVGPFGALLGYLRIVYMRFAARKLSLLWAPLASLLSLLAIIICYYCLAHAIGAEIAFATLCTVVPLSVVAASVPLSLGGLGIREGTLIYLLERFGVSPQEASAMALGYLCVLIIATAPGGLLITKGHSR